MCWGSEDGRKIISFHFKEIQYFNLGKHLDRGCFKNHFESNILGEAEDIDMEGGVTKKKNIQAMMMI